MTKRILLILLILAITPPTRLPAQSPPTNHQNLQQLFSIARNLWAPIELQQLGYLQPHSNPLQTQNQLRHATLFLL